MSNSDKSVVDGKKSVRTVTWAILIGAGLVWWFYPQIRAAIEPEPVVINSEELVEETELPAVEAEETELLAVEAEAAEFSAVETGSSAVVDGDDTAFTYNSTNKLDAQEVTEVVPQAQRVTSTGPVEQNQDETATQMAIVDATETTRASNDLQPQIKLVNLPKFDLVRIEENGAAVIAGLADGIGYVVLSVDGVELPDARAQLNGGGQFVIFASLPSTQAPQALRLHLYTEGQGAVIISAEIVFVAAAPKTKSQDAIVFAGDIESLDSGDEPTPPATVQSEIANVKAQPTVILADESGVRVLQDSSINGIVVSVSIDTISYNLKGDVSIGGRAVGHGFVRVYLDNNVVTTSRISDNGYWTVDLMDVTAGIYTLRVDELDSAGEILSRAETPFKREEREDLVALMDVIDETSPAGTSEVAEVKTQKPLAITQTKVEVQARVEDPSMGVDGAGLEAEVSVAASEITEAQPIAAATTSRTPSVTFRVKTVQPGSTLWAIAKESYGAGIEYFKVFEANKERIRDPDLIYPGQVFEIPD